MDSPLRSIMPVFVPKRGRSSPPKAKIGANRQYFKNAAAKVAMPQKCRRPNHKPHAHLCRRGPNNMPRRSRLAGNKRNIGKPAMTRRIFGRLPLRFVKICRHVTTAPAAGSPLYCSAICAASAKEFPPIFPPAFYFLAAVCTIAGGGLGGILIINRRALRRRRVRSVRIVERANRGEFLQHPPRQPAAIRLCVLRHC